MQNTQLFVPDTILAGYNERSNTYTGKLAYLIYKDTKGKLRKEKSWRGWIQEKLGTDEFENVPTEGFVINKTVGGYKYDWFYRSEKVRVYDPRGFEIEITLDNLLFILEHTNSIKGKGLEGELVYGWVGADLFLIPCDSPQYKEIKEYNDLLRSDFKVNMKTIALGATYKTDKEKDVVYLGRYNHYENKNRLVEDDKEPEKVRYHSVDKGKKYWFYDISRDDIIPLPLNQIKALVNDVPDERTSGWVEMLLKMSETNQLVTKEKYIIQTKEEFLELLKMLRDKQSDYRHAGSIYLLTDDNEIRAKIVVAKDKNYHYREGAFWNSESKRMISASVHIQDIYIDYNRDKSSYSYGKYRDAYVDDAKSTEYVLKKLLFKTDHEQFKDYNKFDKYYRDFKIEDKLLEEFVEQKWDEVKNKVVGSYYALYGREQDDLFDKTMVNETNVTLSKKHKKPKKD